MLTLLGSWSSLGSLSDFVSGYTDILVCNLSSRPMLRNASLAQAAVSLKQATDAEEALEQQIKDVQEPKER
jgi:hypothetical protein